MDLSSHASSRLLSTHPTHSPSLWKQRRFEGECRCGIWMWVGDVNEADAWVYMDAEGSVNFGMSVILMVFRTEKLKLKISVFSNYFILKIMSPQILTSLSRVVMQRGGIRISCEWARSARWPPPLVFMVGVPMVLSPYRPTIRYSGQKSQAGVLPSRWVG